MDIRKLDEFYGIIIKQPITKPLMGPNSALCLEREKKINYLIRFPVVSAKAEFFF